MFDLQYYIQVGGRNQNFDEVKMNQKTTSPPIGSSQNHQFNIYFYSALYIGLIWRNDSTNEARTKWSYHYYIILLKK